MESSNDLVMEPPNLVENNLAKDEKVSESTAVAEPKPKLPEEIEKWSRDWHEATTASDLTNHVLSPILRFYTKPGLPPYYKAKTLIFCSTAYKEDEESPRDLESRRYFLEKARVALQRCETYTNPEDCKEIQKVKDWLDEEWQGLVRVEAAAKEDGGDGQVDQ